MNINSIIGNNLRSYRKIRGLTQAQLSELSGVHRTTLGKIERGVKSSRSETLQNLADALDIAALQLWAEFDERGCLVLGRSSKELREKESESPSPRHKRGREKKEPQSPEQPKINYGIIAWSGNILYGIDVKQEHQELASQTIDNLLKYGCPEEELAIRFKAVWPQIQKLYGIN